ncbi:MAG TPA: hypothetical protein VK477_07705, partial [Acidobacteriota bacterium]|nr:hypothetical protein [Acidobacteriota bacterium]
MAPLGAALVVTGAKLGLIAAFGSDQPFADQWAAEGAGVIRSSQMGLWQFQHFFAPHGEHTPTIMRIVTAGTTMLNSGQWDSRAEMFVSVGALALAVLLMGQIVASALPERWRVLAMVGVALLFAMPCNKENYLWGFQTPFVSLITFGLAHLCGTLRAERIDFSWCIAQVAGCVAIFTVASGMLSAFVLAGYAGLRLWREPRSGIGWATLAANLVLAGLGIWVLTQAFFAFGSAKGLGAFVSAMGYLLAWPFERPWLAFVLQAPAFVFIWRQRSNWSERPARMLIGLVIWSWLLAAAFAWGRGVGPGQIAGRYLDHLTVALAANFVVLLVTFVQSRGLGLKIFAVFWMGGLALGVYEVNEPGRLRGALEAHRNFFARQTAVVSDFLVTNDPAVLERDPGVRNYLPHLEQTKALLMDPVMRTALPGSLAETVSIQIYRQSPALDPRFRSANFSRESRAREHILPGGTTGAVYLSRPIADDLLPVWRFRVSGRVGPGAARLVVKDAGGQDTAPLDPAFDASDRWKTIHLLRPSGPVRLEIRVPA